MNFNLKWQSRNSIFHLQNSSIKTTDSYKEHLYLITTSDNIGIFRNMFQIFSCAFTRTNDIVDKDNSFNVF